MFFARLAMLLAGVSLIATSQATEVETEVCIVGGGSGGYSAAIAAARAGARCVLVEQNAILGGTSTAGYVCNWEPGPGGPLAREVYERLLRQPGGVGITRDHNPERELGSFGLWLTDPDATYEQTLRRAKVPREQRRAVVFDPEALHETVLAMLTETGRCEVLLETKMVDVVAADGVVRGVVVESADGRRQTVRARVFIDATGGVALCRKVGCEVMVGPDPAARFGERSAPERSDGTLNAISRCYRIRRSESPTPAKEPDADGPEFPRSAHISALPGGDLILNPLAMLPGRALIDLGYEESMRRSEAIVAAHWHWFQQKPTFQDYELVDLAPMLGIRESYRVVTEYILTQHDLEKGLSGQSHADVIAVADHSMDVHGKGGRRVHGELAETYGVPYRCLIPKGTENLLVACRGAGFSHIAASSCRLSRTIMQLGRAAGLAAAMAVEQEQPVRAVDVAELRQRLELNAR